MLNSADTDESLQGSLENGFWEQREPIVASVLARMESAEDWTHDDSPGAVAKLQTLFVTLEQEVRDGTLPPDKPFLDLVGYIRSGKAIRLIQWIDAINPGYVDKLISSSIALMNSPETAGESSAKSATLFVDRLMHLERMYILYRVFSPESLRDVLETLDEVLENEKVD